MANVLGTAVLELSTDDSGLERGLAQAERRTRGWLDRFKGLVGGLAIGGLAVAGVQQLAGAVSGVVSGLISENVALENVQAQLLAFTKDSALAAQILADIRAEAAKTPFAFQEMAAATAGLLPAARQSGAELMELVRLAEILAASNPAQGLEGAAFALREALSGDFTSIIERFNLPRKRINELKEQGVPALQAVQTAMQEMGLDMSLVSNLAQTASGRWSTFLDTLSNLKALAMEQVFQGLSKALADVQGWLDANSERLQEIARVAGTVLGRALQGLIRLFGLLARVVSPLAAFISRAIGEIIDGFNHLPDEGAVSVFEAIGERLRDVWVTVRDAFLTFVQALRGDWTDDSRIRPVHRAIGQIGLVISQQVLPFLQTLLSLLTRGWNAVSPAIGRVLELIRELGLNALQVAAAVAKLVGALVSGDWRGVADQVAEIVRLVVERVAMFGELILSLIRAIPWGEVGRVLADLFAGALGLLGSIDWGGVARSLLDGLVAALRGGIDLAGQLLDWIGEQVGAIDWAGLWDNVTGLAEGLVGWVQGQVGSIDWDSVFSAVTGLGQAALDWVTGQLSGIDWGAVTSALGEAGSRIADGIVAAVQGVTDLGQRVASWVREQLTGVDWQGTAQGMIGALRQAVSDAAGSVQETGVIDRLLGGVDEVLTRLGPVGEAVRTLAGAVLDGLSPLTESFRSLWNTILTEGQPLLQALMSLFQALQPLLTAVAAAVGVVLVGALGLAIGALNAIVGFLAGALPGAIQAATGVINTLVGLIHLVTAVITGLVQIAVAIFKGDWSAAWEAAKEMVSGVVDAIGEIVGGLIDTVVGLFRGLLGGVTGALQGFVDGVIGFFQGLYDRLVGNSIVPDLINGIVNWFLGLPGQVLEILGGFVESAVSKIGELKDRMVEKAREIVDGLISGIREKISEATQAITDVKDAIAGAIPNPLEVLRQIGRDVLNGLVQGMRDVAGSVGETAKEIIGGIPVIGEKILGIGSPSRVMAEMGQDIIAGLVQGMSKERAELAKAAADAVRGAADAIRAVLELAAEAERRFARGVALPGLDALRTVRDFGAQVAGLLAETAPVFSEEVSDGIERVADAIEATVGALGETFDLIQRLRGLDPERALDVAAEFFEALPEMGRDFLRQLSEGIGEFDQVALALTGGLAETIGKVVDAMGTVLDLAERLSGLDPERALSVAAEFFEGLPYIGRQFLEQLSEGADAFESLSLEASGRLAGAISATVEALTGVLDLAERLAGVDPDRVLGIAAELIEGLPALGRALVAKLDQGLGELADVDLARVEGFAATLRAVLDPVQGLLNVTERVDALLSEGRFREVPQRVLDRLQGLAVGLARSFALAAETVGTQTVEAARSFAEALRPVLDAITPALEAMEGLRSVREIRQRALDAFAENVRGILETIAGLRQEAEAGALDAEALARAFGRIVDALGSIGQLGGEVGISVTVPATAGALPAGAAAGRGSMQVQLMADMDVRLFVGEREFRDVVAEIVRTEVAAQMRTVR